MQKYLIRTKQNGGEYYGYTTILCDELRLDDLNKDILYADNVKIQFCELIEEVYLIGEEDGLGAEEYHNLYEEMREFTNLYSIYNY